MPIDMKKVVTAMGDLVAALGLDEEEQPGSPAPTEPAPQEPETEVTAADDNTDPEDPEKKKTEDEVTASVGKAVQKYLSPIQKQNQMLQQTIGQMALIIQDSVKKQAAQEKAFETVLEGYGLKEQVMKAHEQSRQQQNPKEPTTAEALMQIGKSFEAALALVNPQGVRKSAPHSVQTNVGAQQSKEPTSVVDKDFVSSFTNMLKVHKRSA